MSNLDISNVANGKEQKFWTSHKLMNGNLSYERIPYQDINNDIMIIISLMILLNAVLCLIIMVQSKLL